MRAVIVVLVLLFSIGLGTVSGDIPQMITYQGLLTDDTGAPVADGTYSLTFRLYGAETGGTELWSETQSNVFVNGGLFRVFLGSVNPITLSFDAAHWLEIQVGSGSPQLPRIRLTSMPYSFTAQNADHVDSFDASATPGANILLALDASGKFPSEAIPSVPAGGPAGGDLEGTYPNPTIAADAVTSGKIQDGDVQTADIADDGVTTSKIAPDVVSSIDGVSNDGGDVDLVAGANVTITADDGANTITISAASGGGGDITAVEAGQGLTGGGESGDLTLDVGAGAGIDVGNDAVSLASGYADGSAHDGRFVNEGQGSSVTSDMIVDGTIQQSDMGFSAGDITAVWPGDGTLTGGSDQGDVTLAVANPLVIFGTANGVINGAHASNGHSGWLATNDFGVLGRNSNGNEGQLGTSSYGVFGQNTNGPVGYLGSDTNGVRGESNVVGVYGRHSNGTNGALGLSDVGAVGFNNTNSCWGELGSSAGAPGVGVKGFAWSSTDWAGYFEGDAKVGGLLVVDGDLYVWGSSKNFLIDHPLDPENKLLRHSCVESPENLLIYRGKANLDARGEAVIEMPDYFKALTKEDDASIHLTPVGRPFLTGAEWNGNFRGFTVYGEADRQVFWEVLADRDDPVTRQGVMPVEIEKTPDSKLCAQGKLLRPTAYGYPESMGQGYQERQGTMQRHAEMAEQVQLDNRSSRATSPSMSQTR